jgi:hypothetical protein
LLKNDTAYFGQFSGHNLEDKTEVKHKYLEAAITNLDISNAATRQESII